LNTSTLILNLFVLFLISVYILESDIMWKQFELLYLLLVKVQKNTYELFK
jgi:hypothetical protein